MKIKTNADKTVMIGVQAAVHSPACGGYVIDADGRARILPQVGGITYNVRLGDSVFGWAGEAVEPGVSVGGQRGEAMPVATLACVGNEAAVVSGDAKGAKGRVIGKHIAVELKSLHVLVDFTPDVLERLDVGDRILIKAQGAGLEIWGSDVSLHSVSPQLLDAMELSLEGDGLLSVPVAAMVPGALMGFMLGMPVNGGNWDMMTDDRDLILAHGLDRLRLGDVVFLQEADCSYTHSKSAAACSVGLVVCTDNPTGGRGIAVLPLMTSQSGSIRPVISEKASLVHLLRKIP